MKHAKDRDGFLRNDDGPRYDYDNQCWVVDGKVAPCGHGSQNPVATCYACQHAGEFVFDNGQIH